MRSSNARWKNSAMVLIAILASLGICELVVRNFVPVRNVGPSFTRYDSYYGQLLKQNFSGLRVTPEFTMRLTTNSDGFRGPQSGNISSKSKPILFLGDSFTMGYGVNDGEEYPALVRKALRKSGPKMASVINAGMGDSGNGRWVKFLRAEGGKIDPGIVVLQIHANDFQNNISERLFERSPTGELIELPVPSLGVKRRVQSLVEAVPGLANSYLIGLGRQLSWPDDSQETDSASLSENPARTLLEEQLLFRLLEEVLEICENQEWQVLAVLADIPRKRLRMMEDFFNARKVLTVVIPTKRDRPDLYYKVDGHWNASGHRFTSGKILDAFEKPAFQKVRFDEK
jgi:hypothetical protein